MADLSKLKQRRSSLGAPPSLDEASQNLKAPEVAPVLVPDARPRRPDVTPLPKLEKSEKGQDTANDERGRIDGRSLRKSRRLVPFANRVTEEFDERLRRIAQRDGLLLVEVLEQGLDADKAARQ